MYTPKYLALWTHPDSYVGASWPDHYGFLGRSRDSDALERANFDAGLAALSGEQIADDDTVLVGVIHESHWAVGWVEWIAIHKSATDALQRADAMKKRLEDYPVLDDGLFSEYEQTEADETWKNCFDLHERCAYIREHANQFEFRDFADLIGCVRGKYFAGYASELVA